MASKLDVDEIAAKNGTDPVTLTKQSAAKAWVNINGSSGTPTSRDSFNVSSITDYSTGRYAPVLTSAMSDANYSACGNTNANTGDTFSNPAQLIIAANNVVTTTTNTFEMTNYNTTYSDSKYCFGHVFGDLA